MSWLNDMFIEEAKHALNRHAGGAGNGTGGEDVEGQTYILIDEEGNEIPAVYTGSEIMFDATANDIREGKTAVTGAGITTGTKEIPSYIVTEGYLLVLSGKPFEIPCKNKLYNFTKLQAIICPYNSSVVKSVSAEKVAINESVYDVNSDAVIADVTKIASTQKISLGLTNTTGKLYLLRYFTYKEEY